MAREWKVGDKLENRWEIHKVMKGGMGVVYLVYDHEWNEVLAAKTFQDEVFARSADIAPLFEREALAWVQLEAHPNIAQAAFVKTIEGKPVLFLEYVSGGDLGAWVGTARLTESLPQVLRFAVAFCDGMIHMRSKGIEVHRDIKPQNCLITENRTLKVTDFGLAKVAGAAELGGSSGDDGGDVALSQTGESAGTVTHMPPEQFTDSKHVGVEADVYSFGVMLFQMLTGKLPFTGKTRMEYRLQHMASVPPLEQIQEAGMRAVVAKCLEKKPAARWRDFEELREVLGGICERVMGAAPPRPVAGVPAAEDAGHWLNKGLSLASLGKVKQAMGCYDRALAIHPRYAEAWVNKGNLVRDLGDKEEALVCFDRALGGNPRLDLAWYSKGATLTMLGREEEGLGCLERALEINPQMALAWSSRGIALDKRGRADASLASFDRALALDPRFAGAWMNKANILRNLRRLEESLACHDQAVELQGNLAEAWYNRANVLADLKRLNEAVASYGKALALDGKLAAAWLGKGSAHLKRHEPNRALECLERCLELEPRDANAWFYKAEALEKLERGEEAAAAYGETIAINPRDGEAWLKRAMLLDAAGKDEEAFQGYVEATKLRPQHVVSWHNRAVKAKEMGRLDDALASHDKALALDPELDEGLLGRANVLAALGRVDEALQGYDRLLELHPGMTSGWFSKGATLGNARRFREALACFEKAGELGHPRAAGAAASCRSALGETPAAAPEEPQLDPGEWHNRGADLAEAGKAAEALVCFDKVLAVKPDAVETLYGKAIVLGQLGRAAEAEVCYEKVCKVYPDFAPAWFSRGLVLWKLLERHGEAVTCFEKAVELGHDGAAGALQGCRAEMGQKVEELRRKGLELSGQGKGEEALECFGKATAMDPRNADVWMGRAMTLSRMGRREEQLASIDKALELQPGDSWGWYMKGMVLGATKEGLACAEKAAALGHPKGAELAGRYRAEMTPPAAAPVPDAAAWCRRGKEVAMEARNPAEALQCFERAIGMDPRMADAWWGKGVMLAQFGQLAEAVGAYDQALMLNPRLAGAWMSKGAVYANASRFQEAMGFFEQARLLGEPGAAEAVARCRQALGWPPG